MKNLVKKLTSEHTGLILCKPTGTSGYTFSTQSDPQHYVRLGVKSIEAALDGAGHAYSWIKENGLNHGRDWYGRQYSHDLSSYWLVLSREAVKLLKGTESNLGEVGEILEEKA